MPQNGSGEYSLYFHVPFCTKKCGYCHFYVIPNQQRYHTLYMEALKKEWEMRSPLLPTDGKLISIYFGGGTPSLLGQKNIDTILSWINPANDVEITLEANPETVVPFSNVNRVSLGVQSFDPSLLTTLTRTHTASQAQHVIYSLVDSGIQNITIDLMYDLPGQTLQSWETTLDTALTLPIQHLSLYNLTIEPHTSFYKQKEKLKSSLPSNETSLRMLEMAIQKLEAGGLQRYEISAFAKPGFTSRHNTGYWKGRPFLGFGPSAFSYWKEARFRNCSHLHRYAKKLLHASDPTDFQEKLDPLARLKERVAIQLRLLDGLERWPDALESLRIHLEQEGYLENNKLTNKGLLFHDTVAELIINC